MKKKANIYDADDVERSKRLNFTPEERAARAEHKAEVLGTKLEKAKKKVPKKKKLRLQKELDPEKSRLKHTLRFEEVEKKRGQEALPKKAGRRMVQSASATVHSKMPPSRMKPAGSPLLGRCGKKIFPGSSRKRKRKKSPRSGSSLRKSRNSIRQPSPRRSGKIWRGNAYEINKV